ncbi:hypothetical protein GJAV_G00051260 [Gymnothorax javanicus]|nr:hypothetical protein GJAV_G00051260 [Gymnothorax javanicus]
MIALVLSLMGFVINVWAQSDGEVEVERNVTGILGEEVFLRCQYRGQEEVFMSSWVAREAHKKKRLAGYLPQPLVIHGDFSLPVSLSNLTVSMRVSSLEAEREYWCIFNTLEDTVEENIFLTVLARPFIVTNVEETVENGTHYQTDSAEVTCVIRHPALPKVTLETVQVQTFVAPNVTLVTRSGEEGAELQEVSCTAEGGRPAPNITWRLPGDAPDVSTAVRELWNEETSTVTVTSSVNVPPHLYEGRNVTCVVSHPKLLEEIQRTITLPTYELSSVRVFREESVEMHSGNEVEDQVVLMEGQRNISIRLEVTGNVPHYQLTCTRENGSLPQGVEVTGSALHFEGPIRPLHAGLYPCQASYYSHSVSVTLKMVVSPVVVVPAVVPPNIKTQTGQDVDHRTVECSASDAFPPANVSWNLPEALSGTIQLNSTFRNGTHSVTSILRLPVCSPQEHAVECVIAHPALATSEIRTITLPECDGPNITVTSSSVWEGGIEYTEVVCSVDGGVQSASISWSVEDGDCDGCASELIESLTAFGTPEKREILVPLKGREPTSRPPTLSPAPLVPAIYVRPVKTSSLWLAVCELKGVSAIFNISWVLPENSTGRTAFHSGYDGGRPWAKGTYEFSLADHEGKNLTCRVQDGHSRKETYLHIPRFYVSSLRVLNKTTLRHRTLKGSLVRDSVPLQARTPGQRILLKVDGKVPWNNITCSRGDGSAVRMDGEAMVFPPDVSEKDAGLYTCRTSFYHHVASTVFHVEVISDDDLQLWMLAVICLSAAAAVSLVLLVSICVFCKKTDGGGSRSKASHRKRESLAALTCLMQDPSSPDPKKPPEYSDMFRYSIVIDIKTSV